MNFFKEVYRRCKTSITGAGYRGLAQTFSSVTMTLSAYVHFDGPSFVDVDDTPTYDRARTLSTLTRLRMRTRWLLSSPCMFHYPIVQELFPMVDSSTCM